MARYKCVRPVVVPDPDNPGSRGGVRYLRGEVFEANPPTRAVGLRSGTIDWLVYAVSIGALVETDEPLTGPGRDPGAFWPVENRLRLDGSETEAEPDTEVVD